MPSMYPGRHVILIYFFFLTITSEGRAMSLFNKWIIFSEVNGVVTDHGKPIAGVVVNRSVWFFDKEELDSTTTDSKGNFKFNRIVKSSLSLSRLYPHEIVVTQRINFNIKQIKYKAWICIKRNYDDNGELGGKPIDLVCDISNEYIDNNGKFMGISRLR